MTLYREVSDEARTARARDPYAGAFWRVTIAYGNFLFRFRNVVFPVVMVLLFVAFQPAFAGGSLASDAWLNALGLLIVIAGQAVRAGVIGLAYIKRGGLKKKVYAENLVTEGVFAHCRNPLYVGNFLMLAGYFVLHNSPWVYLLGGAFFLYAYRAIVAAEEQYLHGKFGGAYEAYCRDVPRWWIEPRGLGRTFQDMTFNWRRVLLKDYATAQTWLITVLGLLAYEAVVAQGVAGARDTLIGLAVAAAVVFALALAVRVLKKSKRLVE